MGCVNMAKIMTKCSIKKVWESEQETSIITYNRSWLYIINQSHYKTYLRAIIVKFLHSSKIISMTVSYSKKKYKKQDFYFYFL